MVSSGWQETDNHTTICMQSQLSMELLAKDIRYLRYHISLSQKWETATGSTYYTLIRTPEVRNHSSARFYKLVQACREVRRAAVTST